MGFYCCGLLYLSNDDVELFCWVSWGEFVKIVGVIMYMFDSK